VKNQYRSSPHGREEILKAVVDDLVLIVGTTVFIVGAVYLFELAIGAVAGAITPKAGAAAGSKIASSHAITNQGGELKMNLEFFGNKSDIKMINDAASQIGVDRVSFGEFIHMVKNELGMRANQNFSYQQLLDLAKDLKNILGR